MNYTPPVKLIGKIQTPIWSGSKLSSMYGCYRGISPVGEAWLTSAVAGNESTVIADGETINFNDYLNKYDLTLPPLIKILDASSPLSIQVHPDEKSADILGGTSKSEMWYVLAAEPGSYILYGIKPGITDNEARQAIIDGSIEKIMNCIPVQAGDVFMIPPGLIHSLGAGITVLEVQNNHGTTYRVKDICGSRETHTNEALSSFKNYSAEDARTFLKTSVTGSVLTIPGEVIAYNKEFMVTRCVTHSTKHSVYTDTAGVTLFCERGTGFAGDVRFTAGDSLYLPCPDKINLSENSAVIFAI